MARIRSIKPEFWISDQVTECSIPARLMFVGLWTFCDDGGRMPYSPKRIKKQIFPADQLTLDDISRMLDELSSNALGNPMVSRYRVEGKEYLQITGWVKHQRIDRPSYQFPDQSGVIPSNKGEFRKRFDERSTAESSRVDKKKKEKKEKNLFDKSYVRIKGGLSNEESPRARKSAPRSVASPPNWPSNYREQFEENYPHKVGMAAALKQLDAVKNSGRVSWRVIESAIASYVENKPTDRNWMNPSNWLKQERWNDRPARTNSEHKPRHVGEELADEARRLEGMGNGPAVSVGGAELGGENAQVVSRNKPS